MPTPTNIDDLSTVAGSNYPAGTDSPAALDDVQRAHASFIAQLREKFTTLAGNTGASLLGFLQRGTGAVLRTIQAKLFERVNVDDYGADPTGAVESTVAFQRAIDALPARGGTVYGSEGEYVVGTLNFPNDPKVVNFVGAGKHATVLRMATPEGPMFRKTPTFGRITGALFSDFTLKAHAASDKTNLAHKAFLLTGWSNTHFKRIAYRSQGTTPGSGSVGILFDVASHPYLTYQNTFEGIDCSLSYGPSRVWKLNNNGQTVFENPNIVEIRDSWFYALAGCDVLIDGADCTNLKVKNNIFEDCPGTTAVIMGQSTLVEGNWFELMGTNIRTNSTASTDGSGSVVMCNYFSGVGTSFIDTINAKPLWIGNAGGGQTITGQGVIKIEAPGASPAAPTLTGGDGSLSLVAATTRAELDISGRVTYLLRYTNSPATAVGKQFTVSAIAGYTIESMDVGVIRSASGDPKAIGIDATAGSYWVAYTTTDSHVHNVVVTFKKS